MKYIIIYILTFTSVLNSHSQSLKGSWDGWYINPSKHDTVIMKLDIRLKQDGNYEIYDFTKEGAYKGVCSMKYKLHGKNSIYLEEIEVIKTNTPDKIISLQNMKLQISKDFKTMTGTWFFNIKQLRAKGQIYFFKKE